MSSHARQVARYSAHVASVSSTDLNASVPMFSAKKLIAPTSERPFLYSTSHKQSQTGAGKGDKRIGQGQGREGSEGEAKVGQVDRAKGQVEEVRVDEQIVMRDAQKTA